MSTFFPNLDKKITGLDIWKEFAGNLELEDPNIRLFEHLDRQMNCGSHPLDPDICRCPMFML